MYATLEEFFFPIELTLDGVMRIRDQADFTDECMTGDKRGIHAYIFEVSMTSELTQETSNSLSKLPLLGLF